MDKHNEPLPQIDEEDITAFAQQCEDDPVFFIKTVLKLNLSDGQKELVESMHDNPLTVAVFARQIGKTTAVAAFIVWCLYFGKGIIINETHQGEDILVTAPSLPQAKLIYDKVRGHINRNELLRSYVLGDMTLEKITLKNGNICRMISAGINAQIRGYSPTRVFLDESQDISDDVFYGAILPMTKTTRASITKAGTPSFRNHFYLSAYEDPSAHVIIQPYTKCPFVDPKEIEKQRSDKGGTMPISLWQQQYECVFLAMESTPLPPSLVQPCLERYSFTDETTVFKEPIKGDYVIGVDLGRERDSTVIIVLRRDQIPYRIAHIESYLHVPYTSIMGRLKILSDAFNAGTINVDQTTEKGWGDLAAEVGIGINPINFNLAEKENMISNLRVLFEKKLLQLPRSCEILYMQCVHQQQETTIYGRKKFFHSQDEHDDYLWATCMAAMALTIDVSGWDPVLGGNPEDVMHAPVPLGHTEFGQTLRERDATIIKAFLNNQNKDASPDDFIDCLATGGTGANKRKQDRWSF